LSPATPTKSLPDAIGASWQLASGALREEHDRLYRSITAAGVTSLIERVRRSQCRRPSPVAAGASRNHHVAYRTRLRDVDA
jgi:hypothetical protein